MIDYDEFKWVPVPHNGEVYFLYEDLMYKGQNIASFLTRTINNATFLVGELRSSIDNWYFTEVHQGDTLNAMIYDSEFRTRKTLSLMEAGVAEEIKRIQYKIDNFDFVIWDADFSVKNLCSGLFKHLKDSEIPDLMVQLDKKLEG